MKKTGFTLAEVLITLVIIGAIAALTMPSLMTNVQKQQTGPALAKAVNTLETANDLFKTEYSVSDIRYATVDGVSCEENYLYCLTASGFLKATKVDSSDAPRYDGNSVSWVADASSEIYQTKDGFIYYNYNATDWSDLRNNVSRLLRRKYSYYTYDIYIDLNGQKGPNKSTRDLFNLLVDSKGTVIPAGGKLHGEYNGSDSAKWRDACNKNEIDEETQWACAGSIADNGWNVIYPY